MAAACPLNSQNRNFIRTVGKVSGALYHDKHEKNIRL